MLDHPETDDCVDNWVNGNRTDVIRRIEQKALPIDGARLAVSIALRLQRDDLDAFRRRMDLARFHRVHH